jgi:arylsulfatase A-like enzyme
MKIPPTRKFLFLFSVPVLPVALLAALWTACSSRPTTAAEGNRPEPGGGHAAPQGAAPAKGSMAPRSSLARLKGAHHPVFDLYANRSLAHPIRDGGIFIPAGHPGFAKHMNFRRPWITFKLNKKVDGVAAAVADKPVSWVAFPASASQAGAKVLSLSVYSTKGKSGLRLKLNKKNLDGLSLNKGWQTVHVNIPAGAVKAGENKLELRWSTRGRINGFRAFGAVQWMHLGANKLTAVKVPAPHDGKGLYLPSGGGVAYYVYPYKDTKLRLRFPAQAEADRCKVQVKLAAASGSPISSTLEERIVQPGGQTETYVDLSSLSGQVGRLEITAAGSSCKALTLTSAALVQAGPAPVVKRPKKPKNVIFWLVDTLRSDVLSAYNPKTRVTTPVFDQLVKTGTVFPRAFIQGNESRVSHASIWTSMYPKQARFINPKNKMKASYTTLPEAVKKGTDLYTACWVANGFISRFWGFADGFKSFRNTLHKGGGLDAKRLADHGIKFIQNKGDKPFYLYIGTIDPHVSYRGRQPWLDQYSPPPYNGRYKKNVMGTSVEKMVTGKLRVSKADKKRIKAIYDSTVSFNDKHLGRLLDALEKKGIRDETMIVITGDHGEEHWENGRIGHGSSVRNTVVAVPLIIHYPPLFGAGVRVEEGVDVLSIMPTILDALGADIPDRVQGESLMALAQGVGRGYPRPAFASQYELAHTVRLRDWKLRVGGKGVPRMFDLSKDRWEKNDLNGKVPLATRWLTDSLSTFLLYQHRWRSLRWGVASNHKPAFSDDLENGTAPKPIRP